MTYDELFSLCKKQADQLDKLTFELEYLKGELGIDKFPYLELSPIITHSQAKVLKMLMVKDFVTPSQFLTGLYYDRPDQEPSYHIVSVFISHLRKALKPYDIIIHNNWGQGYHITPQDKAKVIKLIEKVKENPDVLSNRRRSFSATSKGPISLTTQWPPSLARART